MLIKSITGYDLKVKSSSELAGGKPAALPKADGIICFTYSVYCPALFITMFILLFICDLPRMSQQATTPTCPWLGRVRPEWLIMTNDRLFLSRCQENNTNLSISTESLSLDWIKNIMYFPDCYHASLGGFIQTLTPVGEVKLSSNLLKTCEGLQ